MKLSEKLERLAETVDQTQVIGQLNAMSLEAEALEKALLRAQAAVLLLQRRLGWVIDPAE